MNEEEILICILFLRFKSYTAKVELFNSLSLDHRFSKIKIEIKQADEMSRNQQHAFVREHFQNV